MRTRSPFLAPRFVSRAVLAAAAITVLLTAPVAAHAATEPGENTPLGLSALGQAGSFYDVTIAPGQTMSFDVERINPNTTAVEAQTYVGNVFTIVNGGFGAGDGLVTAAGASTWVDYPSGTLSLGALARDTTAFTVAVPEGTAPGQYVSSIVLENAATDAAASQFALSRVVRTAVAISVRVPGELTPAFSLGQASLGETAQRTVITVETSNTGNQHLKPAGDFTLRDSAGDIAGTTNIEMGSFYAQTDTSIAATLDTRLAPGDYTLDVILTDPLTGVSASLDGVPLSIADPDLFEQYAGPIMDLLNLPPGLTPLTVLLILVGLLLALVVGFVLLAHRYRKRQAAAVAAAVATAVAAATAGTAAEPATIKHAEVPSPPSPKPPTQQ